MTKKNYVTINNEITDMKDYLESKGIYSEPHVPYSHFNIYKEKINELEERIEYLEDLIAKNLPIEEISSEDIDALFESAPIDDDLSWMDEIV